MADKPVSRIELTSYTSAEELTELLRNLNRVNLWEVERVPNPNREENEPDFYLIRKEGDNK